MGACAKSKRANVFYMLELVRRLVGRPAEALAVHPGAALTNLQQHTSGPLARMLTPSPPDC
jgi:hypothetical protein